MAARILRSAFLQCPTSSTISARSVVLSRFQRRAFPSNNYNILANNMATQSTSHSQPLPKPDQIVTYPIASHQNGGALYLFGNPGASNIVLMCAGFPDDQDCFLPLASKLANKQLSESGKEGDDDDDINGISGGCLVGVTCLPGFDDRDDFPYTKHNRDGYTFDEMANALREAAKVLRSESSYVEEGGDGSDSGMAKFTVIFHDIGVLTGMKYVNRCIKEGDISRDITPDRIVLFDVMPFPHPGMRKENIARKKKQTAHDIFLDAFYKVSLATAFLFRRYVSRHVGRVVMMVNNFCMDRSLMWPLRGIDTDLLKKRQNPIELDRLAYMGYPYFNALKMAFTGQAKNILSGFTLPKDMEQTPVLYMYGTNKKVNFHSGKGLEVLEREQAREGSECKVVAMEGCGHWFYLQKPDVVMAEVARFISDA